MKRIFWFVFSLCFFASCTCAAEWPAACGPDSVQYKTKTVKDGGIAQAAPAMAQVVLIETLDGDFFPAPTVRFAIDGAWVGADRGHSYFVIPISPGAHKLCASRQSGARAEKQNIATADISPVAGTIYYFEFSLHRELGNAKMQSDGGTPGSKGAGSMGVEHEDGPDLSSFKQLSANEAQVAMKNASLSTSVAK